MDRDVTEAFTPLLAHVEISVTRLYEADATLTDLQVLSAYEALARHFRAEAGRRPPPPLSLHEPSAGAFEVVRAVCDYHLGRPEEAERRRLVHPEIAPMGVAAKDVERCLKRLQRSLNLWNKQAGRRGYFEYVRQFAPPS
jgi:hypothetical protein